MNSNQLRTNIFQIQERIAQAARRVGRQPEAITLVAVTKTVATEIVKTLGELGIRHIGENRVADAHQKRQAVGSSAPFVWHMIGHLQRNKVKDALAIFDVVHSIDSVALAQEISRRATRPIAVLLEVNTSQEPHKDGFSVVELEKNIEKLITIPHLQIQGLMTMAPQTHDLDVCRNCFRKLAQLASTLNRQYQGLLALQHLSMGMSQDFEVAIEEGATMVRIGSALFHNGAAKK